MDQCTHEVRAEYWKGIIRACGQRPAGQSAKSWMDENGICEQSYYHWQRKIQTAGLWADESIRTAEPGSASHSDGNGNNDISFVEIPCCPAKEKSTEKDSPVAVIRTSAVTIEITNRISDALLHRILQEAAHA